MTRKQERMRRFAGWFAIIALGCVAAGLAALWLPMGGTIAVLCLIATAWVGNHRMIAPVGVAVLTYHSVSPDPYWLPWSREIAVHPETFARHLATLRRMGCTMLGTRDYLDRRAVGETTANAVVLHFDDGYLDNWLHAVPTLDAYDMPATFFASLDFIEPGDRLRTRGGDESGYMTWAELRAIEQHPLFAVEPHGVDHGRVPISDRIVGRVTEANWRALAWLQWANTTGPKHDWYRIASPVAAPIGSPVPESALALAAPAWRDGERESIASMEARIAGDLSRCRREFADLLGRAPQIFCWPENAVGEPGRRIAASFGYRATTGGRQRNTRHEPADVISRIHMGDRAIGIRWPWMEGLHLRALVRLAQGNHYWYLVIAPMNVTRSLVMRLRAKWQDFA